MSDDLQYKDGDIVWVKLGSHWWPGEVTALHRQPEGLVKHLKRKPYCVVKFFQEDAYEYVKNTKQIYPFQSSVKEEFIAKGLALFNAKKKFMEKFPADVDQAERLTRKPQDIIKSETFIVKDRPDSIVKAILGQSLNPQLRHNFYDKNDRVGEGCGKTANRNNATNIMRRSGDSMTKFLNITPQHLRTASSKDSTATSTIVKNVLAQANDALSAVSSVSNMNILTNRASSSRTDRGASSATTSDVYRCNLCDFTSLRQNVIIFHRKSHIRDGTMQSTTPITSKETFSTATATEATSAEKTSPPMAAKTPLSMEMQTPLTTKQKTMVHDEDNVEKPKSISPVSATPNAVKKVLQTPVTPTTNAEKNSISPRLLASSPFCDSDLSEITLPPSLTPIPKVNRTTLLRNVASPCPTPQSVAIMPEPLATPKRNSEEIRQSLLADWSDEEKDDSDLLVVSPSGVASNEATTTTTTVLTADSQVINSSEVEEQTMKTATSVEANTAGMATEKSKHIRNIPKKDRRDVVLKQFNNEHETRNNLAALSPSDTPPIVSLDSGSCSSNSTDSVVVVDVLAPAPVDSVDDIKAVIKADDSEVIELNNPCPAVDIESGHSTENENAVIGHAARCGGSAERNAIPTVSCFDFEEEEENASDLLTSITNFKKQYISIFSDKSGADVLPVEKLEQKNGIAVERASVDKANDELAAEIETLLEQTVAPQIALHEAFINKDDDALVRQLPIKERGKRIFKSRNRSPVEQGCLPSSLDETEIESSNVLNTQLEFEDREEPNVNDNVQTSGLSDSQSHQIDSGELDSTLKSMDASADNESCLFVTSSSNGNRDFRPIIGNGVNSTSLGIETVTARSKTTDLEQNGNMTMNKDVEVEVSQSMKNDLPLETCKNEAVVNERCDIIEIEEKNLPAKASIDEVAVGTNIEATDIRSGFASPIDENSSVGVSEAGAEFGSPTSMLDDERMPALSNNPLIGPTDVKGESKLDSKKTIDNGADTSAKDFIAKKEAAENVVTTKNIESNELVNCRQIEEEHKEMPIECCEEKIKLSQTFNEFESNEQSNGNNEKNMDGRTISLKEDKPHTMIIEEETNVVSQSAVEGDTSGEVENVAGVVPAIKTASEVKFNITEALSAEISGSVKTDPILSPRKEPSAIATNILCDEKPKRKRRSFMKITPRRIELPLIASGSRSTPTTISPKSPKECVEVAQEPSVELKKPLSSNSKNNVKLPKNVCSESNTKVSTTDATADSSFKHSADRPPSTELSPKPTESSANEVIAEATRPISKITSIDNEMLPVYSDRMVEQTPEQMSLKSESIANHGPSQQRLQTISGDIRTIGSTLAPIEKVRINVDVGNPLSSQMANILSISSSHQSPWTALASRKRAVQSPIPAKTISNTLKRKKSIKEGMPGVTIERPTEVEDNSSLSPRANSEAIADIAFDINNMPIVISNEVATTETLPVVITSHAGEVQRQPGKFTTNPSKRVSSSTGESMNPKAKGSDSRGHKYVIIKTPPAELLLQATSPRSESQYNSFNIGSNVTVRSVGESTIVQAAQLQKKLSSSSKHLKSPAAAATGGRKQAGNTIALPVIGPGKQQSREDILSSSLSNVRRKSLNMPQQRRLTQCEVSGDNVGAVSLKQLNRRLSATVDIDMSSRSTSKKPKLLSSDNFVTAQQQLLQLKQQQQESLTLKSTIAAPIMHHLHNRKPRKQPQQHRNVHKKPLSTLTDTDIQQAQLLLPQAQQDTVMQQTVTPPPIEDLETQQQLQQLHSGSEQQQQRPETVHATTFGEDQSIQIQPEEAIDSPSNILAVPTQPIPGYNETFLLCTLVNNTYKPIDNVPLYLDHDLNQLVPVPLKALNGQPSLVVNQPPPTEDAAPNPLEEQQKIDISKSVEPVDSTQLMCLQSEGLSETVVSKAEQIEKALVPVTDVAAASAAQIAVFLPAAEAPSEIVSDNAIILNIEGQQIILDAATFSHLLANPDSNTQLITDDGTEFVLTREVLAALEAQHTTAQNESIEQQLQMAAGAVNQSVLQSNAVSAASDILAVALAGSDLYGNEVLEIEAPQGLQFMNTDGTLLFHPAVLPQAHLTPPITAHTSETNAVLNQTPIMSTLEKPSTTIVNSRHNSMGGDVGAAALLAHSMTSATLTRPNLEDSLAVIGVTAQSSAMPSSLELPITVTNPAIAPKAPDIASSIDSLQYQPSRTVAATSRETRIYNDPGS